MREEQAKEPALKQLGNWLLNREEPSAEERMVASPEEKFCENRDLFLISKGIIYKKGEGDRDLLVVPKSLINEAISLCHDLPTAGHPGKNSN